MNNIELITDALRELGVIDSVQPASPEDAALALRKLNQLMDSLARDGIDLGYFAQTDVSDECPMEDADCNAVMPILAMTLTVNFPSTDVPQMLPAMAEKNLSSLLRDAVLDNAEEASLSNLPRGEGSGGRFNILTG